MINLCAKGKKLSVVSPQPITTGSVGIKAKLTTDTAWNGLAVTVTFKAGITELAAPLDSDGGYTVPWELLSISHEGEVLCAGVCGISGTTVVYPTVYAAVGTIEAGANPEADPSTEPTPSLYTEIMAELATVETQTQNLVSYKNAAEAAKAASETAKTDAEAAQAAAETAEESAETAAAAALNAKNTAEQAKTAAESAAVTATAKAAAAVSDATTASAAATAANTSALAAQTAANSMSYVSFGMDDDGHVLIKNSGQLGTTSFELKESGHLEVTV